MTAPIGRRPVMVRVGRTVLTHMLMAAIENIAVPPLMKDQSERKLQDLDRLQRRRPELFQSVPMSLLLSRSGLPVAGLLLGTEGEDDTGITLRVEGMVVRSANRSDTAIWTHPNSPALIAEVAEARGLGLEVVGDFFSMPSLDHTPDEIELSRRYQWQRVSDTAPEFVGDRVSIALTITRRSPEKESAARAHPASVVRFQIGDWDVWAAAMLPDRRFPTQGPKLVIDAPDVLARDADDL